MQSSLVDFAVRTPSGGRRLTLAEADRSPLGDALAVLLADPREASPGWPATVAAYRELWAGYKACAPIVDAAALVDSLLPPLAEEPEQVIAAACWSGRVLRAWASPSALVLVRRGERLLVLDAAGFIEVAPDSDLLGGGAGEGLRRGRLHLDAGDQFIVTTRVHAARTGLWRLNHALGAGSVAGALAELRDQEPVETLILGQVTASAAVGLEAEEAAGRHSGSVAAADPVVTGSEGTGQPSWPVPDAVAVATGPGEAPVAAAAVDGSVEVAEATQVGVGVEPASESFEEQGEEIIEEEVEEVGEAGEDEDVVELEEEEEEEEEEQEEEETEVELEENGAAGIEIDAVELEEDGVEPAAATPSPPASDGGTPGVTFYVRDRHASSRRRRASDVQGSLFTRAGGASRDRGVLSEAAATADPAAGEAGRPSWIGARLRARRLPDDRSGQLVVRGLTWIVLGTSVVLTLAIIILLARLLTPREGPAPDQVALPAPETAAAVPSPAAEPPPLPALQVLQASWSRELPAAITSSPVVVAEQVIFGCRDGSLNALRITDGTPLWQTKLGTGIGSSPAFAGQLVVVGTYDGEVVATAADTGEVVWRFRTGARVVSSPAVTESGTVVAGSNDRTVYGLSLADGSVRWQVQTGGKVWASPIIAAGGAVLVGSHDRSLYCIDAATGVVRWRHTTGGSIYSSAAVSGDRVAVGSNDQRLHALSLADGTELWTHAAGAPVAGAVTAAAGAFLVGTDAGELLCVEGRDGSRRWAVATGSPIKSRPRVVNGKVWCTGYDGKLHVVDLESGSEVWSFSASGRLYSSPAVIGRTAFFGSMGGRFYAATWPLEAASAAGGAELPATAASPRSSAAGR